MSLNDLSPPEPITLETVKRQFERWRSTRVSGSRVPKHLWDAVWPLTKQYTYSQLGSELKISPLRLRAKMQQHSQVQASLPKNNFVDVPLTALIPPAPQPPSLEQKGLHPPIVRTLEFTRPDGTALKASGLNHKDLYALVKNFLGR